MKMFDNMFGKVANGMCRLSMNGGIAVKTNSGYKVYNLKKNRLVNCNNFVFDIGDEFFFVIPTNKVEPGDIILVNGKPRCVVSVKKDAIQVVNYEDSTAETILPERHVFMGNTYFYGKIVSMFGNSVLKGGKGGNKLMSYMMMSQMLKGTDGTNNMGNLLPLMLMNGGSMNIFGDLFDGFESDDDEEIESEIDDDEDEEE